MRYALNNKNERIEVTFSGERAKCDCCYSEVVGNAGAIRPKYWRHLSKDCDSWYEPITEWHLRWQNYFPKKNQEVVLKDQITGISHRADICLSNNLIIEIQNSPIKIEEVKQRENFYGKLIWVLNGATLAKSAFINYPRIQTIYFFYINFPSKKQVNPIYCDYSVNDVHNLFTETIAFYELFNRTLYKYSATSNDLKFEFHDPIDFNRLKSLTDKEIKEILEDLYGKHFHFQHAILFEIEFGIRQKPKDEGVSFHTRFKRRFFNEMSSPVFFENIPGLDLGDLYYYQKNQIIKKDEFLKKYLAYT